MMIELVNLGLVRSAGKCEDRIVQYSSPTILGIREILDRRMSYLYKATTRTGKSNWLLA